MVLLPRCGHSASCPTCHRCTGLRSAVGHPRVRGFPTFRAVESGAYGVVVVLSTLVLFYLAFVRYRDPAIATAPSRARRDAISRWCRSSFPCTTRSTTSNRRSDRYSTATTEMLNSSSSTMDLTMELARCWTSTARRPPAHCDPLRAAPRKKHALVYAARQARGSIFMFTDSDCIVAADAISICVGVFRGDPNVGAVSGHARALNRQASWLTRLQDVWYDGQFAVNKAAESSFSSVMCVSGPLAAFRREAIVNYLPAWADDRVSRPTLPVRHRPPAHCLRARSTPHRRPPQGTARR